TTLVPTANLLHANMDKLTEVIIHDIFSPPVSSRIYNYTSVAAYEAIRFQKPGNPSYAAKLNGFPPMPQPQPGKKYNYMLAATRAFFTVAEKITFTIDILKTYQDSVYAEFASALDEQTYTNSLQFGESIGKAVLERSAHDNYKETRGMPKFTGSYEEGKWRPTPPDYMDASEPYWAQLKPLTLDSATQMQCPPPPAFSKDKSSAFFKTAQEVYDITKNMTEEQREIARYWDDNPFVIEHSGHLMFGKKKITPVGHWIGITMIACKEKNADAITSARAYLFTSTAIFDVIVTCWKTKYTYEHIRPITVINEMIDQDWQPFLQTPPFPEHTSGHSGISAAAATVLTKLFGNFAFTDTSDLQYIGMKRNFQSFTQAAQEASISRVYGGIHYTTGVNAGAEQGQKVGEYVMAKLLRENEN
ncbi:MAG TPA: vanadium-dependent haloperoxidase, partial [Chitinophagaceae bacterium]|nr:vanadium-dependent haloperoxidase [Chitinophagaceae bacterium]